MGGGPGREVTAKHLSGISSEDNVSGKSEEQGGQALRIRVGNKERVNVLRWKTSRGECGSVSARGPVGDTQHVENHIGVCISRLIHLGRHRHTAPPRKSPRPLYNVVYDNRKGTSWKSGGGRDGGGEGGTASRQEARGPSAQVQGKRRLWTEPLSEDGRGTKAFHRELDSAEPIWH